MMIDYFFNNWSYIVEWSNQNQGILSIYLFCATIFLGWITGFFSSIMRNPKLKISAIDGPTFVCVFGTGKKCQGYDVHRTGIALYLSISNIGSAPTSIIDVEVGYRWAIAPFRKLWWKHHLFRFWLRKQAVSLEDFQVSLGPEHLKLYPFLTQRSHVSGLAVDNHLDVGRSTNGVVYFEQSDSYGACFPASVNFRTKLKVRIIDSYGKAHAAVLSVPRVTLAEARVYNPKFGCTLSTLHSEVDPVELSLDKHGNLIPPSIR